MRLWQALESIASITWLAWVSDERQFIVTSPIIRNGKDKLFKKTNESSKKLRKMRLLPWRVDLTHNTIFLTWDTKHSHWVSITTRMAVAQLYGPLVPALQHISHTYNDARAICWRRMHFNRKQSYEIAVFWRSPVLLFTRKQDLLWKSDSTFFRGTDNIEETNDMYIWNSLTFRSRLIYILIPVKQS